MRNRIPATRLEAADPKTAGSAPAPGAGGGVARPEASGRWVGRRLVPDQGTTTAEYAIVTMAAVTFGGLLLKVVGGGEVAGMLTGLVRRALSV
jgi:hypothetical protein